MSDWLALPQGVEHGEPFINERSVVFRIGRLAERRVLGLGRHAKSDAQHGPSFRQVIDGGHLARQHPRTTSGDRRHHRAEADPCCRHGCSREHRPRLAHRDGVLAVDEDVVPQEPSVPAAPLGSPSDVEQAVGLGEVGDRQPETHRASLTWFTQRQAAGKFTRTGADELIARSQASSDETAGAPTELGGRQSNAGQLLRRIPAEQLAGELQRRGWLVGPRDEPSRSVRSVDALGKNSPIALAPACVRPTSIPGSRRVRHGGGSKGQGGDCLESGQAVWPAWRATFSLGSAPPRRGAGEASSTPVRARGSPARAG